MSHHTEASSTPALLERIRQAFARERLGDGISLHEAAAIDNGVPAAARAAARRRDPHEHWWDVPDDDIARHDAVFSFLDRRGHRFYAPAYMSWLLRHGYGTSSNTPIAALRACDPWGCRDAGRQWRPDEFFSADQCRCIAGFLQHVAEVLDEGEWHSTAQAHLDAYWSRYL